MKKYFIGWNADKTEGFITDDHNDAKSATTGKPHRALGYPAVSTAGQVFFEAYAYDQKLKIEEVEL